MKGMDELMAQEKKYKLGDLEFETEQEYREAAADLKRIKGLVDKYNVEDPQQAAKILASIKAHPETFRSPYGRKFVVKLEKAANISSAAPSEINIGKTEKQKKPEKRNAEKR